ncbi:epithelial membrane protein 1 [Latimeria chalumnae]|nr:PREDICTED: epithelial membrane protein 1 [Latimeria chalumnae]|eukprot:XP_006004507.1 PREDICTED: epithelial membrane protein 1 [Latimeria chalumnae]
MLVLLGAIFIFHITSIITLLISTIDNSWWVTEVNSMDIWKLCFFNSTNCVSLPEKNQDDYLQAVQACMVLSCIFAVISLVVFVLQLFTLEKGQRFTISGIIQLLSCLCVMIAAIIYAVHFHKDDDGWYGYSFVLAWFSFALTLIIGIIYLALRKKGE